MNKSKCNDELLDLQHTTALLHDPLSGNLDSSNNTHHGIIRGSIIKNKLMIMPNKYPEKKGWNVPKQKYKITNWPEYNAALRSRGRIDVWISEEAINLWYEVQQPNDGTGAQRTYSDFAMLTCHELRLVYKLPLCLKS